MPEPVRARARELATHFLSSPGLRRAVTEAAQKALQAEPEVSARLRAARSLLESVEHVRVVAILHDLALHLVGTAVLLWGLQRTRGGDMRLLPHPPQHHHRPLELRRAEELGPPQVVWHLQE